MQTLYIFMGAVIMFLSIAVWIGFWGRYWIKVATGFINDEQVRWEWPNWIYRRDLEPVVVLLPIFGMVAGLLWPGLLPIAIGFGTLYVLRAITRAKKLFIAHTHEPASKGGRVRQ